MKQLTVMLFITGLVGVTISCNRVKMKSKSLELDTVIFWIRNAENDQSPIYFKSNCISCHMLSRSLIGPPLMGMMDRLPSREWLKSYVTDERSLLKSGDTTALRISKQSSFEPFHQFSSLTDDALDELIRFTEQSSGIQ